MFVSSFASMTDDMLVILCRLYRHLCRHMYWHLAIHYVVDNVLRDAKFFGYAIGEVLRLYYLPFYTRVLRLLLRRRLYYLPLYPSSSAVIKTPSSPVVLFAKFSGCTICRFMCCGNRVLRLLLYLLRLKVQWQYIPDAFR